MEDKENRVDQAARELEAIGECWKEIASRLGTLDALCEESAARAFFILASGGNRVEGGAPVQALRNWVCHRCAQLDALDELTQEQRDLLGADVKSLPKPPEKA